MNDANPRPALSVVVPCFNEEENAARYPAELFAPLDALGVPWEALLVDDGSTDGTRAALEKLAASEPRALVLPLSPNRGLAAALRAGFAAARGEWTATIDADLTFPPSNLRDLLDAAKRTGADLVAGSPYLRAEDFSSVPFARRLPSLMMNAFYRGLFGLRLTAYTPVFRLYRTSRLRELDLVSEGFEINAEIAARFLQRGWPVAEVPAPLLTRTAGVSKLSRGRELRRHLALMRRLLGSPRA